MNIEKETIENYEEIMSGKHSKEINQALMYQMQGQALMLDDSVKALEYLQKAHELNTKYIGTKHYMMAILESLIGQVYYSLNQKDKALQQAIKSKELLEALMQKTEATLTAQKKDEHYYNLANGYWRLFRYYYEEETTRDKAKEHYDLALTTFQKISMDFPHIANVYESIAKAYWMLNRLDEALEYNQEALQKFIKRENSGKKPIDLNPYNHYYQRRVIIKIYVSMALIHQRKHNHEKALQNIEQAIIWGEHIVSKQDYTLVDVYYLASTIYHDMSIWDKAYHYALKAFNLRKDFRDNNFTVLDNDTKEQSLNNEEYIRYIPQLLKASYSYLRETVETKNESAMISLLRDSFKAVINYKGEVSNFNSIVSLIEAQTDNQNTKESIGQLKKLKTNLSKLYQNFDRDNTQKIEIIKKQISDIEIELSKHSNTFKAFLELQNITYQDIASYLKPHQLYIDCIKADGLYYIFTIDAQGNIMMKHTPQSFEDKLKSYIQAIKTKSYDAKYQSQEIYKIFGFYQLTHYRDYIISPDGLLNFIPFEALHDGTSYLIESKTISYVSNAKEFIKEYRRKAQTRSNGDIVVFANADFNMKFRDGSRGVPPLLNQSFGALEGTQKEADTIKGYYPNAQIYTQQEATVENLMNVHNPKILHIATHGFYLEDKNMSNSLQKSGLALSGAAQAKKIGDTRGIVTALSLSTLNLAQTHLVVLSACETGLGDLHNFDSVSSLASAFIQAGSKNVIMSLWKIDDEATSKLIKAFYDMIAQGKNYKDALRGAKLTMIEQDPFHWSALTLHGV